MVSACFFIPLAPKDSRRVLWTIKSIRLHCTNYHIFVLLDGTREQFPGLSIAGDDAEILLASKPSGGHWGAIWQMQNSAMMHALQRSDLSSDCVFVRIDADAIVVRPGLVERAQSIFNLDPSIGQLGQCHTNIVGEPMPNQGWANWYTKMNGVLGVFRMSRALYPSGIGWLESFRLWSRFRVLVRAAVSNGFRLGEFAIGPSILRLTTVRRLFDEGWLTESPFKYFSRIQDDVAITPHVYAVGYRAVDDVAENGLFAICGKEPWIHPFKLRQRGHYIIHSIKYGVTYESPYLTEAELAEALVENISPESVAAAILGKSSIRTRTAKMAGEFE